MPVVTTARARLSQVMQTMRFKMDVLFTVEGAEGLMKQNLLQATSIAIAKQYGLEKARFALLEQTLRSCEFLPEQV